MCKVSLPRIGHPPLSLAWSAVVLAGLMAPTTAFAQATCPASGKWVTANVVALDQVFIYNRRGAFAPGMIYALERDVVAKPATPAEDFTDVNGNGVWDSGEPFVDANSNGTWDAEIPAGFMLREDKRPRPLTLRVNVGDCMKIHFTNRLSDPRVEQSTVQREIPGAPGFFTEGDPDVPNWDNQPAERAASIHVIGMQLLGTIASDGSNVGRNVSSLVTPGNSTDYYLYAEREGTFLMYSGGAQTGGEGDGGSIAFGLFGAINVEPAGSVWYRSQVTRVEMDLAQKKIAGVPQSTPGGQPILNYDATYPIDDPRSGGVTTTPILKILGPNNEIVHSDLTAIITDPCAVNTYPLNPALPNRCQPFREFTAIFHDEIKAVQAFAVYEDDVLGHTLHSVRDGFAINYGTGGIGSEIIANRLGLGPEGKCTECKYEEFFLTSWALGDPNMVTDVLANASNPATGDVATVALYPDDPSNVYHSYLNDHVKIRNLHAGPKEHHIFHLHAHQWMFTPDSDESAYLDSQAIGPGSSYTYDIAYDGGGNRNKTPGDAIFHCHFYPHFAQGMWALWRVHDVFENGTPLDVDGKPVPGNVETTRALPDGEIVAGTPTPGVVPLPGLAMAPMPTADMPGYPFYIPGVAGHRPPKPPLDTEVDGGLPRHVVNAGVAHFPPLNRLDFDKVNDELDVTFLPETGTALELKAMNFHAAKDPVTGAPTGIGVQPSFDTDGNFANFRVNGLPGIAGAPYADPCVDDVGRSVFDPPNGTTSMYTYRAAGFRLNVTYNKVGWKNPQHHMEALDQDVSDFLSGTRAPEPFFFRANSNSCIEFYLTNLFPNVYQLDDFQVRTPTDVLGQHIHLVKFDVTASDGSANGFNYEDGSLAPDEVTERIHAIRVFNGCLEPTDPDDRVVDANGQIRCPVAEEHPFFKNVPEVVARGLHLGAQTTIQRWYADSLINNVGDDRTLRTVYTHDHFAPSTQQQAGYYAGLLIEPEGSQWLIAEGPDAGTPMGTRADGGPTSWQAVIEPGPGGAQFDPYREFMFEAQDFALAYQADANNNLKSITDEITGVTLQGVHDPFNAINPPAKKEIGLPFLVEIAPQCPGGVARPCPEAISADDPGTFLVNYRNEPIPLRVRDPMSNTQVPGVPGDLSHVFRSDITRVDTRLNSITGIAPYPPLTGGLFPGDPFTPLWRTYEADKVQIRTLVGAHEEGHNFTVHGIRWLFEPSWANSGYRNSQMYGISEHFEFEVPAMQAVTDPAEFEDFLYQAGAASDNMWNGMWGIMRAYKGIQPDLLALSTNRDGRAPRNANPRDFQGVCKRTPGVQPRNDPRFRKFHIVAMLARDLLASSPGAGDGKLVYNSRLVNGGPLTDPNAILYVRATDLDTDGVLQAGFPVEPLVLRANAHDCIDITLENRLPAVMPDQPGFSTMPLLIDQFNTNQVAPSNHVGLHGQLVTYDMLTSDGANVGFNPVQTVAPGQTVTYKWYAGDVVACRDYDTPKDKIADGPTPQCVGQADGLRIAVPIEFGATALMSSDRIKHSQKGAIGALIIEPEGATWQEDGFILVPGKGNKPDRLECDPNRPATVACTRTSATVTLADGTTQFREFVLNFQDDLNLRCVDCGIGPGDPDAGPAADDDAVPNLADSGDPEDSGQRALNYKTEPMWLRLGFPPDASLEFTRDLAFRNALSNAQVGGDPETPIFTAEVGTPVWFRVVQSGGHPRNHDFILHGHGWQRLPWVNESRELGNNPLSEWSGDQEGIGPSSHFNFLLTNGAGGKGGVTGDYLFRDMASFQFDGGLWGLLRVCEVGKGGNIGDRNCLLDNSSSQ